MVDIHWICMGSSFLSELQRCRINTISQPRWLGAVVKNMSEMRFTAAAKYFRSPHEETIVTFFFYMILIDGFIKAWPSTAGMIFGF